MTPTGGRPRLLYTRDIAEQVAVLYWPQVFPYPVPGSASAVELRQITLPRGMTYHGEHRVYIPYASGSCMREEPETPHAL